VISAPRAEGGLQDPRMGTTLLVALAAFALLFLWLLWRRYESMRLADEVRAVEDRLAEVRP
jgi:hypothetical protein